MCGICGFTGEVLDRDEVIKRMTDVITTAARTAPAYLPGTA